MFERGGVVLDNRFIDSVGWERREGRNLDGALVVFAGTSAN